MRSMLPPAAPARPTRWPERDPIGLHGLDILPGRGSHSSEAIREMQGRREVVTGMRAVVCVEEGAPEKLVLEDRARFEPGPGQVAIDVRACGLNFVDTLLIQGLYQIKPPVPFVPGSDAAGIVESVGEGVTRFSVGDHVMAMPGLNGFAEQLVLSSERVQAMPKGLDFARAAGFLQSYATALFALDVRGKLQPGETVLILAAAGGVGSAAIDVAKALGARVIAAASSDEKLEACKQRGADAVINYASEDLKLRAKELSGGGVDVVYDPVGGDYAEPALRALAPFGRHLVIGFAAGDIPRVRFNLILLKQCQVVGVDWGGWVAKNPEANEALLEKLRGMLDSGRLSPQEPQTYPFEHFREALRDLMERRVIGKAVLVLE
jgi:NADPH2:quinone reductase